MNKGIVALTCALSLAACADHPAQDASSARTTSAPTGTTTTETRRNNSTDYAAGTTPGMGSSTDTTIDTSGTTPRRSPLNDVPDTNPNLMPPAGAAPAPVVANNPGTADQTTDADNTKINDRDRHGALTPMDQGGSEAERKITQAIRQGVVGDKSLSFTAKNVKIITVGSKVTLRGPVRSDQEKSAIEARAKQTAGVTEVDNQLEVKK